MKDIVSIIGVGTYRMSIRSKQHKKSLIKALNLGCDLIDTSSNYTDGEAEELIGEVLKENSSFDPFLITKGGYIQGHNFECLNKLKEEGKGEEDLVIVNEDLYHSIHPDFLEKQIEQSLRRLQKKSLDCFLLHNPEYYFNDKSSNQDEYYRRIQKAFRYLETKVDEGVIGSYGISSNNFPFLLSDSNITNIERVWSKALEIKKNHHFKYIQFPLNLIEIGAMEKQFSGLNLIEKAHSYGLKILINRPLNAFKEGSLLRLAESQESDFKDLEKSCGKKWNQCCQLLEDKWKEAKEEMSFSEVPLIKQIAGIWDNLSTPDAVSQVFHEHFFPFIGTVWGEDLNKEEAAPFYDLYELAEKCARKNMDIQAREFRKEAVRLELLPDEPEKSLSVLALEFYQSLGVDHILVGLRDEKYVDEVSSFFK